MLTFSEMIILAAMTDDSQPDVQPGPPVPLPPWGGGLGQAPQGSMPDVEQAYQRWWTFDPLAGSDSQPADVGYVSAPIGPTPEQAKEAEQDRLWRLVVGTARGS